VIRALCVLSVLCGLALSSFALDRDAFTFTNYDLKVQIEPEQQRLAAEGTLTVRNDSGSPQKNISLQISSGLGWRAIRFEGQPVQFLTQTYTSDIDHTGALSEAIVSLPREVAPGATIALEVRYEGVIAQDFTRLTRIGVPQDDAKHSDWDQISEPLTAVRGVGYVVWYPVAMEAASLAEGNSVFAALNRWRVREVQAIMRLTLTNSGEGGPLTLLCNAHGGGKTAKPADKSSPSQIDCSYSPLGITVPLFVMGRYSGLDRPAINVSFLFGHQSGAESYAAAAEKVVPFVTGWFGGPRQKVEVADLPDSQAAPYESGGMLLAPLDAVDPKLAEVAAVHQLTHAAFPAYRPWIYEGLAHFAQALYVESLNGRQAALDSMAPHRKAIVNAEKALPADPNISAGESLINTSREEFYRSKAMYVWWMLRDMVGAPALKRALAIYRPEDDKSPAYMQKLIEAQSHRDLEWFFDDWVYRDRGLPDFQVKSVYSRKMLPSGYMVTVTVENPGSAGAEIPVIVQFADGERMKRLEVRGKAESSLRFEIPSLPQKVTVNDGSVPESDMSNDVYKVTTAASAEQP
jgi:hypothetical protein